MKATKEKVAGALVMAHERGQKIDAIRDRIYSNLEKSLEIISIIDGHEAFESILDQMKYMSEEAKETDEKVQSLSEERFEQLKKDLEF